MEKWQKQHKYMIDLFLRFLNKEKDHFYFFLKHFLIIRKRKNKGDKDMGFCEKATLILCAAIVSGAALGVAMAIIQDKVIQKKEKYKW